MSIVAISNLKGGVGKSTIAQNIAVQFAQKGIKVCIAYTDTEQKTSAKWASLRDTSLLSVPVFVISPDKVSQEILALKQKYDLVIVDGTPALTELTTRIIILSDLVVVPILPGGEPDESLPAQRLPSPFSRLPSPAQTARYLKLRAPISSRW